MFEKLASLLRPDPLIRPLDAAISQHKKLLAKWNHKQQREILVFLVKFYMRTEFQLNVGL